MGIKDLDEHIDAKGLFASLLGYQAIISLMVVDALYKIKPSNIKVAAVFLMIMVLINLLQLIATRSNMILTVLCLILDCICAYFMWDLSIYYSGWQAYGQQPIGGSLTPMQPVDYHQAPVNQMPMQQHQAPMNQMPMQQMTNPHMSMKQTPMQQPMDMHSRPASKIIA